MNVPLIDLKTQNLPLEEKFMQAFQRVMRSGHFILGEEVQSFEQEAAHYLGVKHALGVSSGTDAILLALMALGIKEGEEVLCPSFTFFATAGCVARLDAVPVFVDVCPVSFNIDMNDARKKISSRTRAIIPVHLFGQAAEMDGVIDFAQEHSLSVVEDAAQAFGARYRGKTVGGISQFGAYSFFPTKNLGAFGDAGLLVTNDDVLAERARILRVHGMEPKYYHQSIGGNFRIDALQAALLRVKLPHVDEYSQKRAHFASRYTEKLSQLPGICVAKQEECGAIKKGEVSDVKCILPVAREYNHHIWNQYTLRVLGGKRESLKQALLQAGIGCEVYYPVPLHRQQCFNYLPESHCPVAETLASECLSIPVSSELTEEMQNVVIEKIADWLKNH